MHERPCAVKVKDIFDKSVIVGKRFPICLILTSTDRIEVSSFSTTVDKCTLPPDLDKSIHSNKMAPSKSDREGRGKLPITWSAARRLNAIERDFSVNAMLYEPCTQLLFDYVNGYEDLKNMKLRCLKDPSASFQEDPARILRAIRFASRLGLSIDDDTGKAIRANAKLLTELPQSRAQLELNAILSYGSTVVAFKLMWRYGILDWILPRHAGYLEAKSYPRDGHKPDFMFTVMESFDALKRMNKPLDEATSVVMIAAPLVAHDVQRIRSRLHSEQASDGTEKDLKILKRQREDVAYDLLVKSLLNKLPQMQGGKMVLARTALQTAQEIFKGLKTKHIHESHNTKMLRPVKPSEMIAFRALGRNELKWKQRSNLGLTMVDPSESCLH